MSHQRYLSHDPIKEPHSVSVKVLRLSCPSLVPQYPLSPPFSPSSTAPLPASLAYRPPSTTTTTTTNPSPFLLSPILNLPVSFGSAYVGETFSCTLCANNDLLPADAPARRIRDVRIEAEMKTPGVGKAQRLALGPGRHTPSGDDEADADGEGNAGGSAGEDLAPGGTLQKVVSFDLKEEGNHVLAVTVSYYEASETSGRTRTFRKLYQFICKASLIVRTKVGVLEPVTPRRRRRKGTKSSQTTTPTAETSQQDADVVKEKDRRPHRWLLEAQLENCSEDTMHLDRVVMELEPGLTYRDCNWDTTSPSAAKPVLHPGEVEQVCFVVEALSPERQVSERGVAEKDAVDVVARAEAAGGVDARILFGVLGIGWRGEMGNRGFLSTGRLGTRVVR